MTLAASISTTGIIAPTYEDILAQLQFAMRSIYGSDIYIDPDSQDGQMLAIVASAINDANNMAVAVYNAFSPATAQGTGLSSVVKINGIARANASRSQAAVLCVGQTGTPIGGGIVGDNLGLNTKWQLPDDVTIPDAGQITVTATCTQDGNFSAAENSLTKILTPTNGWQSVTNPEAASEGNPVEADATLRQRQSISTSLPAQAIFEAILAAVANVPGVGRYTGYENDTGTADANGVSGHSIAIVAGGGDVNAIASAIALKKPPGTGTYGNTEVIVPDPVGVPVPINFFVLSDVTLTVVIRIKPLANFTSATSALIIAAVAAFINGLDIGEYSFLSRLYGPANLSGDAATDATGFSQAQLDALSKTYNIMTITQSRAANIPDTTITDGPYGAGADTANVANPADLYVGQQIAIRLDNAALLQTFITDIAAETITFDPAVPGGRSILDGANLYLVTDVRIAFNEAAIAAANNITVTVVE